MEFDEETLRQKIYKVIQTQDSVTHLNELGAAYADEAQLAIEERTIAVNDLVDYVRNLL
jgi:hypothetical protein